MAGSVKANSIQLGDSATDSQNFLLKTNVDGSGKLARGSAGGLGDILTWDANGKLANQGFSSFKATTVQVGDSATDSQNFVFKTNADGTGKLSRGALGSLGDILVWDANGKLTLAAIPAVPVQSMIRLSAANGHGSTNTCIRRFNNALINQGTDITYADSATLGASFTINVTGVYAISYTDQFNAANYVGLSLNSANLTSSIGTLSAPEMVSVSYASTATGAACAASTLYLVAGAVIRAHTAGAATGGNTQQCQFTMVRVA